MTERNTLVDASTHMEFIFHFTPLELAKGFHQLYNVPTATLQQKFNIFRASARTVVLHEIHADIDAFFVAGFRQVSQVFHRPQFPLHLSEI